MPDESDIDRQQMMADALARLQSALELLDRACAPAQIGAQVDMAIEQLQDELVRPMPDQIDRKAEPQ